MEEKPWESSSISLKILAQSIDFLGKTVSCLSSLSSDPLFSSLVTVYALVLLYFPGLFLGIVFSPVLISTGILLLTLLKLGETQKVEKEFNSTERERTHHRDSADEDRNCGCLETDLESKTELGLSLKSDPNPSCSGSFMEWNVRAPLEVIYEEHEGEEDDQNDDDTSQKQDTTRSSSMEKYPSLSMYYPETDSDSSSGGEFPVNGGWDSPENLCFRWDEEDDREELIEIALDGKRTNEPFHADEDNLIEIDIFPGISFPAEWLGSVNFHQVKIKIGLRVNVFGEGKIYLFFFFF